MITFFMGLVALISLLIAGVLILTFFLYRAISPPVEIQTQDQQLFTKVEKEYTKALKIKPRMGVFPPKMHSYDVSSYAASLVMIRDIYLPDGDVLTRAERELLAVGVSVANTCYYCSNNHAALLRASDISGVEGAVMRNELDTISDPRLLDIALLGINSKNPKKVVELAAKFTADERGDIATTLFTFHYMNRIMDSLGPQGGLSRQLWSKPPSFAIAGLLGLKQSFSRGEALAGLNVTPSDMSEEDEANVKAWTADRPDRLAAMRYTWNTIQASAKELFDTELLDAIRNHLAGWNGEELPLAIDWSTEIHQELSDEKNVERLKLALLVARSAHRVSPSDLLAACDGDRRNRLVLVSFTACATALRITSFMNEESSSTELPAEVSADAPAA